MIPVDDVLGRADWIIWPAGHAVRLHRSAAYARVPDAEGAHG
jgi:signal peptidase I